MQKIFVPNLQCAGLAGLAALWPRVAAVSWAQVAESRKTARFAVEMQGGTGKSGAASSRKQLDSQLNGKEEEVRGGLLGASR